MTSSVFQMMTRSSQEVGLRGDMSTLNRIVSKVYFSQTMLGYVQCPPCKELNQKHSLAK